MNRDASTRSALLAIARNRRVQRALAHAWMHRGSAMPTLRSSLGYMTSTGCITDDSALDDAHRMTLLGLAPNEDVVYVAEELGHDDAPIVYRLFLSGPRQGYLVPIHAWYETADDASEIRARMASLAATLQPVVRSTAEAWMLSTRIVQRRAVRVADDHTPMRKFALQLAVEPVSGMGPSGKTTVTAFLRPNAELVEVWTIGDAAVARVSFTGIPSGLGLLKDTVILLTDRVG
jgi:hypothetical protein